MNTRTIYTHNETIEEVFIPARWDWEEGTKEKLQKELPHRLDNYANKWVPVKAFTRAGVVFCPPTNPNQRGSLHWKHKDDSVYA
jgi:hypothetical protein